MAAAQPHAIQRLSDLAGDLPVDITEDQARVPYDGIEGSAEFMAHVGQELRFVTGGLLQALVDGSQLLGPRFDLTLQSLRVALKRGLVLPKTGGHAVEGYREPSELVSRADGDGHIEIAGR